MTRRKCEGKGEGGRGEGVGRGDVIRKEVRGEREASSQFLRPPGLMLFCRVYIIIMR